MSIWKGILIALGIAVLVIIALYIVANVMDIEDDGDGSGIIGRSMSFIKKVGDKCCLGGR